MRAFTIALWISTIHIIIVVINIATIHIIVITRLRAWRILMQLSLEHISHTRHTNCSTQQLVRVGFGLARRVCLASSWCLAWRGWIDSTLWRGRRAVQTPALLWLKSGMVRLHHIERVSGTYKVIEGPELRWRRWDPLGQHKKVVRGFSHVSNFFFELHQLSLKSVVQFGQNFQFFFDKSLR